MNLKYTHVISIWNAQIMYFDTSGDSKEPIIQNREVDVFHATLLSGQDVTKCVLIINDYIKPFIKKVGFWT